MIRNRKKSIFLAKRDIVQLVTDAVQLQGIDFTVPEVQTLLAGITVGRKKLIDQMVVINHISAWHYIFDSIENETFNVDKEYTFSVHAIISKGQASNSRKFRTGQVFISGTDYKPPKATDLTNCYQHLVAETNLMADPYDAAITFYLGFSKNKFFRDFNKSIASLMMNGILLSEGLPVVNVAASRKTEFNEKMIYYFDSLDNYSSEISHFMKGCIDPVIAKEFDI